MSDHGHDKIDGEDLTGMSGFTLIRVQSSYIIRICQEADSGNNDNP
jgi:hypothetical protein